MTPERVESKIPCEIGLQIECVNIARSGYQDIPRDPLPLRTINCPSQLHSFTLLVLCTTHGTTHSHQPLITLIYSLFKFDRSYSGAVGRPSCSEALDTPPQIIPRRTVIMRPRCPGHSRAPTIDPRASTNLPSKPTVTVSNGQGPVCLTWDKIGLNPSSLTLG